MGKILIIYVSLARQGKLISDAAKETGLNWLIYRLVNIKYTFFYLLYRNFIFKLCSSAPNTIPLLNLAENILKFFTAGKNHVEQYIRTLGIPTRHDSYYKNFGLLILPN